MVHLPPQDRSDVAVFTPPGDTSERSVAGLDLEPIEGLIVLRHRQQVVDEGGCPLLFQGLEPRIFFGGKNDHCRCAVFGHELGLAASRRFHHGAEAVFRIL
jgi:hypothetical protein